MLKSFIAIVLISTSLYSAEQENPFEMVVVESGEAASYIAPRLKESYMHSIVNTEKGTSFQFRDAHMAPFRDNHFVKDPQDSTRIARIFNYQLSIVHDYPSQTVRFFNTQDVSYSGRLHAVITCLQSYAVNEVGSMIVPLQQLGLQEKYDFFRLICTCALEGDHERPANLPHDAFMLKPYAEFTLNK